MVYSGNAMLYFTPFIAERFVVQRIDQQPCYILHTRPYRETSLILEVFTKEYGRIGVIVKGAKNPKGGHTKKQGLLQAFIPLSLSASGRGELLAARNIEALGFPFTLSGRRLISGFYLNELLIRLLQPHDPHIALFNHYQEALNALMQEQNNGEYEEKTLRIFEKHLLSELGYALQLTKEVVSRKSIEPEKFYFFDPENGPVEIEESGVSENYSQQNYIFKGKNLLCIHNNEFIDSSVLQDAKRMMRYALSKHLGTKPLESRRLFF